MSDPAGYVEVGVEGRRRRIEYRWVGDSPTGAPLVVFLHEGLGSVEMWRDFPERFCRAAGCRGLVYSRPGYGRSTPRPPGERWDVDFMHRQAFEVLPAVLEAVGVDAVRDTPVLFGHSDGGSIALLYAGRYRDRLKGTIVLAPHLFVEEVSIDSIRRAKRIYEETDLRDRLGRYHDDPDSAFWGWNDTWLNPRFESWNIEREVEGIETPILAIQGLDDEYGTLAQVRRIAELRPRAEIVEIPDCGHSPHRDQPDVVIRAGIRFLDRLAGSGDGAGGATTAAGR